MNAIRMGRSARGFTIIELMVVLAIAAILMAVGVPSLRSFITGARVKAAGTEIMTAVLIARSEAVKRNASTTVAPVTANDWTSGWTVTGSGTTLHAQEAFEGIAITTYTDSSCSTAGTVSNMVFGNTGRPSASSCFKVTATSSTTTRCVKVDLSGIPSSGSC